MLRRDLGMPPPGDIRNCMEALASAEPIMTRLMGYRFTEGSLSGQSFGNLLLAALNGIMPSFDQAVAGLSQVLAITGRVLPVTNANIRLEAEFENGRRISGESSIYLMKRQENCRIRWCGCARQRPGPAGGGGGYTAGGSDHFGSRQPLYQHHPQPAGGWDRGCHRRQRVHENIYMQRHDGKRRDGGLYRVSDHIRAIFTHSRHGLFDLCLVNLRAAMPRIVAQRYAKEGASRCSVMRRSARLGVELILRPICAVDNQVIRHNPGHVASELMTLYRQRTIRVVDEGTRSARNRGKIKEEVCSPCLSGEK